MQIRSVRFPLFISVFVVLCLHAVVGYAAASAHRISFQGFGPINVGMTIEQAERASGQSFGRGEPRGSCTRYRPLGAADGISWLVQEGTVRLVELRNNRSIRTQEGIHIGSTSAAVLTAYRRFPTEKIDHDGRLIVYVTNTPGRDGNRALLFTIVGGQVISIEAGDFSSMGLIERCS
jgi:hypothetical protein